MTTWAEANQVCLMRAVARVRALLERHAAALGAGPQPEPSAAEEPAADGPFSSALDTLAAAFGLSGFERDVLVLCAGVELDASFAACCAAAQGDSGRPYPTFGLALAALPAAHWSALSPAAPLRHWRLVEPGPGDLVTQSPLRIDERVLHYLAGVSHLDLRLEGIADPVPVPSELPPSQERSARRIADLWSSRSGMPGWPVVQLIGDAPGAARAVAARACAAVRLVLHAVRASDVPAGPEEREAFLRLWAREAVLESSALLLEAEEAEGGERARLRTLAERVPGPVLISVREPLAAIRRTDLRVGVGRPLPEEQLALWRTHLVAASAELNGRLDGLVVHFSLDADAIRSACAAACAPPAEDQGEGDVGDRIWEACRAQTRCGLDQLAQRIEPAAAWEELVLPAEQRGVLREIAGQVRQRSRVYGAWGLGGPGRRGLGITALFTGPSGTGKTMAAEVLAGELRLDLYRIDLSQVVSKYIGETEKNLRRVFDAAEGGGAILLFDEADALFGKRSEVQDSHDRYANIEISYLLQRMEDYRGLAILTTNLKTALDSAFVRRLRFVVAFPFPDAGQREEIWRRIFSVRTPTHGLDPARLARLNVAGGEVRNIALHAAFLAAEAGEPVRMAHLLRAARAEYAKLEKTLTQTEVEGWT